MGGITNPAFMPAFGTGAPGASVPHNAVYYDTSTNPYTPYIYQAGAWHKYGAGNAATSGNATQIQGVNVANTAPNNGDILTYVAANSDWEPKPASGGVPATIVQVKSAANASNAVGVTLNAAPTAGNFLVALITDQATAPSLNSAAGWFNMGEASGAQDGWGVFVRRAVAGDSATQQPCSDTHQGTITIYEINNGAGGIANGIINYSGTAVVESPINTKITGGGGLILGVFVNRTTTGPTSITGTGVSADAAGNVTGVGRAVAPFHISNPLNGANNVTANYATSQGGTFAAISVG